MKRVLLFLFVLTGLFIMPVVAVGAELLTSADVRKITPEELQVMIEADGAESFVLLDLRSSGAYDSSDEKIRGSLRIAPNELIQKFDELPFGKTIVTYCTWPSEASSAGAALYMMRAGFQNVMVIRGGFYALKGAGFPIEKKEITGSGDGHRH